MNITITNFIGCFDNALDPKFCQDAIDYYESQVEQGYGVSRQLSDNVSRLKKETTTVWFNQDQVHTRNNAHLHQHILATIWKDCFPYYAEKYPVLEESAKLFIYSMKIQKTEVGQGYHQWHYESSNAAECSRVLNVQIFLNDVEQGGETEFLSLATRVPPTQGTVLIYPCAFTHAHRGNPPLSNAKYIMNGWIEF